MLRLVGGQVESLWDEVLPVEARELPEDLEALDVLLSPSPIRNKPFAGQYSQSDRTEKATISAGSR